MNELYLQLDIKQKIDDIKERTIEKIVLFGQFLQCFAINTEGMSLNDIVLQYLYVTEQEAQDHVYWVGGGFSWNHLLQKYKKNHETNIDKLEEISTTITNLDVNYIYNDNNTSALYEKITNIYTNLILTLQQLLYAKGIHTKIETENFNVYTQVSTRDAKYKYIQKGGLEFEFIYNTSVLFREPYFNIKLVLVDNDVQIAGAKAPKGSKKRSKSRSSASQATDMANPMHQILSAIPEEASYHSVQPSYSTICARTSEGSVRASVNFGMNKLQQVKQLFVTKVLLEFNFDYYHMRVQNAEESVQYSSEANANMSYIQDKLSTIQSQYSQSLINDAELNKINDRMSSLRFAQNKYWFIEAFKHIYIDTPAHYRVQNLDMLHIYSNVNRLNELGLLTFSYLNTADKNTYMGLNIDKYRQSLFLRKFKKINQQSLNTSLHSTSTYVANLSAIKNYYIKILNIYKILFGNRKKSYNTFFVEKIEHIICKYAHKHYEAFVDFVDKWFMANFRPYINSFILEINDVLFDKYKVKLFVAGGDAMRRYDNDISFTKDIDTKLYVGNIVDINRDNGMTKEAMILDIENIIAEKITVLNHHLEEHLANIVQIQDTETGKKNYEILLKEDGNNVFSVLTKIDYYKDNEGRSASQFRVRKILKRPDFPVTLYSIDFRTHLIHWKKHEHNGKTTLTKIKKYNHNLSILDVILQDGDGENYDEANMTNDGEIPVATLQFLLKDFYTTYNNDDRALARLSSGKYQKDMIRFNRIKEIALIQERARNSGETAVIPDNRFRQADIQTLETIFQNAEESLKVVAYEILNKIKRTSYTFRLNDMMLCNQFLTALEITDANINYVHVNAKFGNAINEGNRHIFETFINLLLDIVYLRRNIYNEDLNDIAVAYGTTANPEARETYTKMFKKLIFSASTGKKKMSMMFRKPASTSAKSKKSVSKKESSKKNSVAKSASKSRTKS
jgi:hypothetical protein